MVAIRGVNNLVACENAFYNPIGVYLDAFSVAPVMRSMAFIDVLGAFGAIQIALVDAVRAVHNRVVPIIGGCSQLANREDHWLRLRLDLAWWCADTTCTGAQRRSSPSLLNEHR